jgi:hypothetical protein
MSLPAFRMSKRQQRNITVTRMLVTVVIVFLICHSVKIFLNGNEFYQHLTGQAILSAEVFADDNLSLGESGNTLGVIRTVYTCTILRMHV